MALQQSSSKRLQEIDEVIERYKGHHGELLGILEQTQLLEEHRFLPEEALNHVALRTGVPLSRIYSVATFYSFFNLAPQGKHNVTVCRGTACHTKGSKALLDDLALIMGCKKALGDGDSFFTTPDNEFTVSIVACFGQCALAPVVAIDGVIHSSMTTTRLKKSLPKASRGGKKQ